MSRGAGGGARPVRALLLAAAVAASVACGTQDPSGDRAPDPRAVLIEAGEREPRDVVLVTVDTLRHDAPGFAGAGRARTPAWDRLAREGVVFRFAHAHAVTTLPSHASLLTGLYPYQHGVRDNAGFQLAVTVPTLAAMLRQRGFATGAFVSAFPLDRRFGLARGFDVYDDRYEGYGTGAAMLAERPGDRTVEQALAWWRQGARRPRFLWVHLFAPHAPYAPPERFAGAHRDAPYWGEVEWADEQTGALLAGVLGGGGSAPIVVFTSDHGEALGDHGERTHGLFAYEATLRVPLVLWAPGVVAPAVTDVPVRHVDVLPTVLDLVGIDPPGGLSGRSLLRPAAAEHDVGSYFEALHAFLNRGAAPLHGRIEGRTKAIDLPIDELYDLAVDPGEAHNLATVQVERFAQLAGRLPEEVRAPVERQRIDPEVMERLRSLGYLASDTEAASDVRSDPAADPKNRVAIEAALEDAIRLHGEGDVAGAVRLLDQVLERDPRMGVAYSRLAYVHASTGRVPEAVEVLWRAERAGVADEPVRVQLANGLVELRRIDEAARVLQPHAGSTNPETQSALGRVAAAQQRWDEARSRFERALALDPSFPQAKAELGILALTRGDVDGAARWLEEALSENGQLLEAWNALAIVRSRRGDHAGAVQAWNRALAINPRYGLALLNVAQALARLGDREGAARALERVRPMVQGEQRRWVDGMLASLRSGSAGGNGASGRN